MIDLRFVPLAVLLFIAGCASNKPVIYPNAHSQTVGAAQAEVDVSECRAQAEAAGADPYAGTTDDAARNTVRGGGMGAATGAVGGAIGGNPGRGAAIGAASGATAGLLHSLLGKPSPSPAYRNFVERCLRDRGYDLAGWN